MGSSDYQKCPESVKEIKTITVTNNGGEEEGVFNKLSVKSWSVESWQETRRNI